MSEGRSVLDKEKYEGVGWWFALRSTDFGIVRFKRCKSHFLREGDLHLFFQSLQEGFP
jgi:hypothetical protein